MEYEIQSYEKNQIMETIDDFVETFDTDKKIMYLGAMADFVENKPGSKKSALYMTVSILYARILDTLDKDDDKTTRGVINMALNEYLERGGVDVEKYR